MSENTFRDQEDLMREIRELRQELEREREENALLRYLLSIQYEKQPKKAERLEFPIPDQAIDLFEGLPEVFALDDVFTAGEKQSIDTEVVAAYVRAFLEEEMIVQGKGGQFTKTGRKPYF